MLEVFESKDLLWPQHLHAVHDGGKRNHTRPNERADAEAQRYGWQCKAVTSREGKQTISSSRDHLLSPQHLEAVQAGGHKQQPGADKGRGRETKKQGWAR